MKSATSFESETKLGLLGAGGINEEVAEKNYNKLKSEYKDTSVDEVNKRKNEIDLLLFNLFVRKDNQDHKQQLVNFASSFSKKQ